MSAEQSYMASGMEALTTWPSPLARPKSPQAQVIDMFSGCGGMSLGFAAVGSATGAYEIVGALDVNRTSLDTYQRNFAAPGVQRDIRDLAGNSSSIKSFLSELPRYEPGKPLVLIGCAPCQGFTSHRKKAWDTEDARNSLVAAFADVAVELMPECIVMENVPELLSGKYWSHFEQFRKTLTEAGYFLKQVIHNAAEYGAPQERFRAIVVAMKKPEFDLPSPTHVRGEFQTVRDAIGSLPGVSAGEQNADDLMHRSAAHRKSTIDVIKAVPRNGGSRPAGVGPDCLKDFKGYADVYGRLSWDKPAITITHYARNPASGRFVHPEQHRGLTKREAARLQGFPDGFEFCGTFDDVFRQIGEAVSPPLSTAIAAVTLANLRGEAVLEERNDWVDSPVNNSYSSVIAGIKGRK